jgi:hypothetical protein
VKFSANFTLLHSKMTPNTTSFVGVTIPCAKWTLMGFATFLATHPSLITAHGWSLNKKDTTPH